MARGCMETACMEIDCTEKACKVMVCMATECMVLENRRGPRQTTNSDLSPPSMQDVPAQKYDPVPPLLTSCEWI